MCCSWPSVLHGFVASDVAHAATVLLLRRAPILTSFELIFRNRPHIDEAEARIT